MFIHADERHRLEQERPEREEKSVGFERSLAVTRRLRPLPTGPNQPGSPLCGSPLDNPPEVLAAPTTGAALYRWAMTAADRDAMEADGYEAVHVSRWLSWLMKKSLDKAASEGILDVTE